LHDKVLLAINKHKNILSNIARSDIIRETFDNKEAVVSECGALATWTPFESAGRSPKDTVMIKRPGSEKINISIL